ncbi:MAG: HD domain-containing protein [Saprospiraceae bacterium]|nr:HD domain-containing protein [Saprospiraceae bacterium]
MDNNRIITTTADHIRQKFAGEGSGHDWWHIHRVWKTAARIGEMEGADDFVVQLAALLHDIADWKFHDGDDDAGPRQARQWLEGLEVTEPVIAHVCTIIKELSFKGAGVPTPMSSLEGQVVQDADRLDAIGAIGIARAFAYGGHKNRELYNPDAPPVLHASFEAYKSAKGTTVNHFYEKLLLLKDRMNTPAARRMAEQRHAFMEDFLQRFFQEWGG